MPQNIKLSAEEKIKFIKMIIQGKISISHTAKIVGVGLSTIQRWIAMYEFQGATAFFPKQHNMVYSPEIKLKAVHDYLRGVGSILKISQKYKLRSERQLWNWVKVYNAYGDFNSRKFSGGRNYMTHGRGTTAEERIQIAKECIAENKKYSEIALKYHISYQQARNWTLRYKKMGEAGLQDRRGKRKKNQIPRTELEKAQIEIEQLKHKLYMAEMENMLLKKLDEIERRDAFRK